MAIVEVGTGTLFSKINERFRKGNRRSRSNLAMIPFSNNWWRADSYLFTNTFLGTGGYRIGRLFCRDVCQQLYYQSIHKSSHASNTSS